MRITFTTYDDIAKLSTLKASKHQRNKHPKDQIERLAKIMKEHGVRHPIHVSTLSGQVCFGHGRWEAAKLNKWTEYPIVYQEFKDDDEEYACVQSDNAIAHWAELDLSSINNDLQNLGPDFDIDLLGIKDFVLEPADKFEAQCDEDAIPENADTRCKLGDVWQLGRHRLVCGDSTIAADTEKLMNGERADICFTSPPYNLGDNAKLRGYNGDGDETIYNEKTDHKSQDEYLSFLGAWTLIALKQSKTLFCNIQILAGNKLAIPKYWMAFHDKLIDVMVWDKEHAPPQMAARVLNSVWEFIFIFTDEHEPKRSIKTGKSFRGTLDNIFRMNPVGKKDPLAKGHGGVFPVAFAEHFATNFAENSVLDLFGGSGSTLIACEKTNRRCFMMELDPHYCDVILARWEKYTGQLAERLDEGKEEKRGPPENSDRRKTGKKSSRNTMHNGRNGRSARVQRRHTRA